MSTLREAAEKALEYMESRECHHESTHRGGVLWTICDDCGRKWADDEGGFVEYREPIPITDLRAALSAPAEPQEAAEPVVIAGRYTAYPQRGTPNHCFNAQVFGPDGLSVATFDSTADPRHAYRYAMALADALNAPAPQPAGGEPQPAAQQEQAGERKPLTMPAGVAEAYTALEEMAKMEPSRPSMQCVSLVFDWLRSNGITATKGDRHD